MDYSSESELIESLDYLTLPVKRSSSIGKGRNLREKNKKRIFRDFRNKVSHKTQTSRSLHKCNDSIILNSRKEIVEYYSIETSSDKYSGFLQSSEETRSHIQPSIIKVTVTPNKTKPHKFNTRRKQNTKHLNNTISVEDRSIQTKHMCLVVAGRKRERQLNIKTTESAKLLQDSRNANHDISLDQVKSVKHVIHSLNMDKKRKKAPSNKRAGSPPKTPKGEVKTTEKNIQANGCQSMVRITGQIGLGQDNQIMVRCGVGGAKVQNNDDVKGHHRMNFVEQNEGTLLHTVSQGTQMDINLVNSTPIRRSPFYPNNVTCFCNNVNNVDELEAPFNEHGPIKTCQNPLVVITVYPNDERCENVTVFKQHNRCRSPTDDIQRVTRMNYMTKTYPSNKYQEDEKNYNDIEIQSNAISHKRRSRSTSKHVKGRKTETNDKRDSSQPRSVSPSTNSSSSQNVKRPEPKKTNRVKPKEPRSPINLSPSRSSAHSKPIEAENRQTRPKTQSPDTNKQKTKRQEIENKKISKKNKNETKHVRSPSSSRSPSPSVHSNYNVKRKGTEKKQTKGRETRQRKDKEAITNSNSIATNTDHILTKKALVDTFTKEIMGQMGKNCKKNNCTSPQYTESQVTINIEGENENYDVFLRQGGKTTDMKVKKTKKCGASQWNECHDFPDPVNNNTQGTSKSLLNTIDIDDFRNGGFVSPNKNNDIFEVQEIKVRDSLEIGHKRKDRSPRDTRDKNERYEFEKDRQQVIASDSFAPVKHYKGDKCLVPNPIKRDKEVRQLLGLETRIHDVSVPPCPCPDCPPRPHKFEPNPTCQLFHANDYSRARETKIITRDECRNKQIKYQRTTDIKSTGTQYEAPNIGLDRPLSKKMILNRNIQVFLQVEKFTDEKPIILSRKQYHKVKRAIEHTISKQPKNKLAKPKGSVVNSEIRKKVNKPIEEDRIKKHHNNNYSAQPKGIFATKETAVLFTRALRFKRTEAEAKIRKHYLSAADIHVARLETANESSTKVAVGSSYSHSIHTIFRGIKKTRTPNFGTSVCSFFSNSTNEYHECKSVKNFKPSPNKQKKPFLKRLMSCLVLRESTASDAKITAMRKKNSTYNTSIDSYHISTSLGAIEMSSSIYDTSESFYSNHSVIPISSKIKKERGFFGSVRGLFTGKNIMP